MYAEKARVLNWLVNIIKVAQRDSQQSKLDDAIATFNALALPRGYIHVCDAGLVHLIYINVKTSVFKFSGMTAGMTENFGMESSHLADVIWSFEAQTGIWKIKKDRYGTYESCPHPIKCGGMKIVK